MAVDDKKPRRKHNVHGRSNEHRLKSFTGSFQFSTDDDDDCACVCRRYVDRLMMLLPSNVTTLNDDPFNFTGENLFSAVSSTPLSRDFRPASDDSADSAPLVQFNITSTSSGTQQWYARASVRRRDRIT